MNTTIEIEEGSTSSDSCKLEDIVDGIRFLSDANDKLHDLVDEFDSTPINDEDRIFIFEDICDYLNEICPDNMIFGAQDCDGACYGFWSIDDDETDGVVGFPGSCGEV